MVGCNHYSLWVPGLSHALGKTSELSLTLLSAGWRQRHSIMQQCATVEL